jgi:hypothetical protein
MSFKDKVSLFWFKLKRKLVLIYRRFGSNNVNAVHRDDLKAVLKNLGLFDDIQKSKLKCSKCNCTITLDSIGAIENQNGVLDVKCMASLCSIENKKSEV